MTILCGFVGTLAAGANGNLPLTRVGLASMCVRRSARTAQLDRAPLMTDQSVNPIRQV
jgi:hypothetical protein